MIRQEEADEARRRLFTDASSKFGEAIAVAECACFLLNAASREGGTLRGFRAASMAASLHLIGRRLLLAFERSCNDGTCDERARKRASESIEALDLPKCVAVSFQSDPRGWPLVLGTTDNAGELRVVGEIRVGGRS